MSIGGLEALPPEELVEADGLLDRANHDIAKYMAMTARNVDPQSMGLDEQARLVDDLLRTDGRHPVWELWRPLYEKLAILAADPTLTVIDRDIATIRELVDHRDEWTDGGRALVESTVAVADRIAGLRRTVRRRLMEVSR